MSERLKASQQVLDNINDFLVEIDNSIKEVAQTKIFSPNGLFGGWDDFPLTESEEEMWLAKGHEPELSYESLYHSILWRAYDIASLGGFTEEDLDPDYIGDPLVDLEELFSEVEQTGSQSKYTTEDMGLDVLVSDDKRDTSIVLKEMTREESRIETGFTSIFFDNPNNMEALVYQYDVIGNAFVKVGFHAALRDYSFEVEEWRNNAS